MQQRPRWWAVPKSDSNSNPTPPTPPAPQAKVETPTHLKGWAIQPKVDTQQPYMVFSTEKEGEQALMLTLAEGKDNKVWIDTNNNGILDKEDVKVTDPAKSMALASKPNVYAVYSKAVRVVASGNALAKAITFTPKQKVYAVYGKVASVVASGNALTAADVRANPALTELNVANNKLSEAALHLCLYSICLLQETAKLLLWCSATRIWERRKAM